MSEKIYMQTVTHNTGSTMTKISWLKCQKVPKYWPNLEQNDKKINEGLHTLLKIYSKN